MKTALAIVFLFASTVLCASKDPWKQPHGLVPDKETAIKIAEAILFPLYGADTIIHERPYNVSLKNGFWYISGNMPESDSEGPVFGGTFYIVVSQWDARVISVGHEE
jgi:hypothetical protein